MHNNTIQKIYPEAFTNLTHLRKLSINGNNLITISKDIFTNLPVQDLTLSGNKISSIETMAMKNLPNLTKLKLHGNSLTDLFVHTILSYPETLEILWLQNNSFTAVTNYMLYRLSNLRVLNVGFNSISFIEANSFNNTPILETLVLTHNVIKELDGSIYKALGMDYLKKLYLDNNRLMFLPSSFFFRLNNLERITLVGNPWFCGCLDVIHRFLFENHILEKCAGDYRNGTRAICVSDTVEDMTCKYVYNNDLSEYYELNKRKNPLYKLPIQCIL
ncbi:hypothetical protein NQ317_017997 [Molorchus minor]|uniref:Uncharacterized protein n=1 Tax=Molorchus minor TaxID=1323400 RepID=A0ABQ9J6R3_9CUCU|nr:hypothetical protein NQ317_017997 [Molorchus minor]